MMGQGGAPDSSRTLVRPASGGGSGRPAAAEDGERDAVAGRVPGLGRRQSDLQETKPFFRLKYFRRFGLRNGFGDIFGGQRGARHRQTRIAGGTDAFWWGRLELDQELEVAAVVPLGCSMRRWRCMRSLAMYDSRYGATQWLSFLWRSKLRVHGRFSELEQRSSLQASRTKAATRMCSSVVAGWKPVR